MGSRIALRLLGAGREVVVWNRSPGPAEELVRAGASAAADPAGAARAAEAVVIMVSDPAALEEVVGGDAGVAAGLRCTGSRSSCPTARACSTRRSSAA
jgi:3-hydroxyisobutyrate dehydrogenase-like beta-hydroxyacid dehydrogenase